MAKNSAKRAEWILLIHQLPSKPTNLRVRIWRKLQKLGAVAIKNSVYLLPANERCQKAIRVAHGPVSKATRPTVKTGTFDLAKYQGRRWMTRRNLHIDRLASAWLIRQFIDKRPRFYFVAEGETVDGAIAFDMYGAEFTHHGEDCTFETLLKRFGLSDNKGLREIAEIVHDIDLKDDRFHRLEAVGLNAVVNALSAALRNDRKLLQQTSVIFDGLQSLLSATEPLRRRTKSKRTKPSRKK